MQAAKTLAKSGMKKNELGRLWTLADVDRDGKLSRQEFSIAMHLVACATRKGLPLPRVLPDCLMAIVTTVGGGAKGAEKGGSTRGVGKLRKEEASKGKPSSANKGKKGGAAHQKATNTPIEAKTGLLSKTNAAVTTTKGSGTTPSQELPTTKAIVPAPTNGAEKEAGGVEAQPARASTDETSLSGLPGSDKNAVVVKRTLTAKESDQLYAMSTAERAGYDVIFMQVYMLNIPRSVYSTVRR